MIHLTGLPTQCVNLSELVCYFKEFFFFFLSWTVMKQIANESATLMSPWHSLRLLKQHSFVILVKHLVPHSSVYFSPTSLSFKNTAEEIKECKQKTHLQKGKKNLKEVPRSRGKKVERDFCCLLPPSSLGFYEILLIRSFKLTRRMSIQKIFLKIFEE